MFDDFYGLTGRPFQLTPDPAFYFESLTHKKALSYLGYGLAQGEGFIVITGEVGAGKSTLVGHLMATIDTARLTAAHVVTSRLDAEELVHVVAQAFGLMIEGHDKASALGAIESFLHDEARAGRRCLLIVDEAQNLSIDALEELRMLSNFQLGAHPLLQTLLLGQPEFRDTLAGEPRLEQLRQRVIATHHLDAMEPDEVLPYIEFRMKCVGWTGNPSFNDAIFAELYAATNGLPRRINQIVNRLLMLGAIDHRDDIDSAMVDQVVAELAWDEPSPQSEGHEEQPSTNVCDDPTASLVAQDVMSASPEAVEAVALSQIESLLSERDIQIGELQQAVVELANSGEAPAMHAETDLAMRFAAMEDRISQLEARQMEQDRTIRHTLTMLIEWIEGDGFQRAA